MCEVVYWLKKKVLSSLVVQKEGLVEYIAVVLKLGFMVFCCDEEEVQTVCVDEVLVCENVVV